MRTWLRMEWLSHIRYHGVLLWNDVTIDWLSVGTWFDTFSAPDVRMWRHGLVYLLFVAQTIRFGMPNVCSTKEEWVQHHIENHEVCNNNDTWVGFRLGEAPILNIKLPLSKDLSLLRCKIGWDKVAYWLQRCQWLLLTEFVKGRT